MPVLERPGRSLRESDLPLAAAQSGFGPIESRLEHGAVTRIAGPALRVPDVAAALVARHLGKLAQWKGAARHAAVGVEAGDVIGALAVLDPPVERAQCIETNRRGAVAAMLHVRHQKQPRILLRLAIAA